MNSHKKALPPWQELWNKVVAFFCWVLSIVRSSVQNVNSGPAITMDTGRKVRLGPLIAEGGFSFVFDATEDLSYDSSNSSSNNSSNQKPSSTASLTPKHYALKQIRCPEPNMLHDCRQEAAVHRAAMGHPNILPILGFAVVEHSVAYMLFPKMHRSLRQEINHRILEAPGDVYNVTRPPWNEVDVLNLFVGIARGVQALHNCQYSHRDIKVENIMLEHANSIRTPVLMDFGSVGPLREDIDTRRQVMNMVDKSSQHTTMPYRPPELFEGGLRQGDPSVDFTKVDVWSLGCTFFAVLYGASPSEAEFARSNGRLRIVDCTQLKVIGGLPKLPSGCAATEWYSKAILALIEQMLTQDRLIRPTVAQVLAQLETIIHQLGGRVVELEKTSELMADEDDDGDLDSLLNSQRGFP